MNVIMCGNDARIYGDDVQTYKGLPPGTYDVFFSKTGGFGLTLRGNLLANEQKIYGDHMYRIKKVLKTFGAMNRNLGIILSGNKGCGKSLFVRLLAEEAISKHNLPVIIVSGCYPGIQDFISSIQQECLVIFDEFEKIFSHTEEEHDPQDALLPMFDGMDNGKKLFVITCNNVDLLNGCLLNRPGRFHYHFDIGNPSPDEIREYMRDNLTGGSEEDIESVVRISAFSDVTYDFLRAIVFELNQGYTLQESMQDLNIANSDYKSFDVELVLEDGTSFRYYDLDLDFNIPPDGRIERVMLSNAGGMTDYKDRSEMVIYFNLKDVENRNGQMTLDPKNLKKVKLRRFGESDDNGNGAESDITLKSIKTVVFKRSNFRNLGKYIV